MGCSLEFMENRKMRLSNRDRRCRLRGLFKEHKISKPGTPGFLESPLTAGSPKKGIFLAVSIVPVAGDGGRVLPPEGLHKTGVGTGGPRRPKRHALQPVHAAGMFGHLIRPNFEEGEKPVIQPGEPDLPVPNQCPPEFAPPPLRPPRTKRRPGGLCTRPPGGGASAPSTTDRSPRPLPRAGR